MNADLILLSVTCEGLEHKVTGQRAVLRIRIRDPVPF
jgi:hypothetical protein